MHFINGVLVGNYFLAIIHVATSNMSNTNLNEAHLYNSNRMRRAYYLNEKNIENHDT